MKREFLLLLSLALSLVITAQSSSLNAYPTYGAVVDESCGNANGVIELNTNGGIPPYTWNWSNGETTEDIYGLSAGMYSVTIKDALLDSIVQNYTILNNPFLDFSYWNTPSQHGHYNCPGTCWGQFRVPMNFLITNNLYLTPPFSYSEPILGYDFINHPYFQVPGGACTGDIFQITITDGNGCSGVMEILIRGMQPTDPLMYVDDITGSCSNTFDGSITVSNVSEGIGISPLLQVLDTGYNLVLEQPNSTDIQTIDGLAPGDYILSRQWYNSTVQWTAFDCSLDDLPFTIPDLGAACGTLSGKVFIDNDQDCVQDPAEVGVPFQILELLPGPEYAITNLDGSFSRALMNGNFTIGQNNPTLIPICPLPQPYVFNMNNLPVNIEFADSSTVALDLEAERSASAARPGFTTHHYLQAKNLSPQVSGMVTVKHIYDPILIYTGANPTPNTISGDTLIWTFPQINAYGQKNINVHFDVPIATPLGTVLSSEVSVSNTLSDADLSNNVKTLDQTVTGSYDPNDKQVQTSTGWSESEYYIGVDEWLDYTVRFQNTGTDTAFTVVVTDTLEAALDLSTFEQGIASHDFTVMFHPDNVVEWTFDNILLPDSGTNEGASHGLVSFRIRPIDPLLPGTELSNAADIFFDFNTPIRTNDAILIAATSTEVQNVENDQLRLFPNPTRDMVFIQARSNALIEAIQLIDLSGRVLEHRSVMNTSRSELSLKGRSSGLYFIRVECTDGTVLMGSVSVQ